jgi:hypothetical protein
MGPPVPEELNVATGALGFQERDKPCPWRSDLSRLCAALRTPTPPWTPSKPRQMMCATPDCRRCHGQPDHRVAALEAAYLER